MAFRHARTVSSSLSRAACFVGLLAAACGGRTGNGLDDGFGTSPGGAPNGAAAGDPGFGGAAGDGSGGQGGTGARGAGGRRGNGGAGGYGTGGYGYGGYAAYPGSGGYGYGGYGAYSGYGGYSYGGYGAYPGYGGYSYGGYGAYGGYGYGGYGYAGSPTPYCQFPSCGSCPDCVSNCLCYGNDPNSCYASCGYGSGGSVGTGGSPSCGPGVCPQAVIPNVGIGLSGCCLSDGTCGVSTDVIASIINVQGGCQAYNQFGTYDGQCAPEPSPVGPPLAGCCRPDGTCGNDLGMLGLGCVQAQRGGSVTFCAGLPMGAGGSATGTGGSTSADQCVANAQSDCERCACKTCNGNLGACFQDAGCPLILQCANQTGCTGVNCYQPSTCQAVIDQFGGIGSTSVSLAIPLFQCASGCGCGFAHP